MYPKRNQLNDPYSSPCSSSAPWDVFLSFHGKDTRTNFVKSLYVALVRAGIRTFRDETSLEFGEEISSGLRIAIKNSNKCVVVLSKNYARSSWCLDELVNILDRRNSNNLVFPVFYHVEPSFVRYQLGCFEEALNFHKQHYSAEIIEKWRFALVTIAGIKGYHLKKHANLDDCIQEIVEIVARQTSPKFLHPGEYLFGLDTPVKEIYQQLKLDSVSVIGICGGAGTGKTTIAKVLYNELFDKFDISCFMENVKRNSAGSSLSSLLEQLVIKLDGRNDCKVPDFESAITHLRQIFSAKKTLLVLDDLDESTNSELLGRFCSSIFAGSKVIITTRDANLLKRSRVDIYMVKELGLPEQLQLFNYHAYGDPMAPTGFEELSERFAKYGGGNPLALKVLGASLRGRTQVSSWKANVGKVLGNPGKELQKALQLGYDLLEDETQKRIFLDIAFFFTGRDKDEAVQVFKSCGYFPQAGIPGLVDRNLLTVDKDNRFQMHNLIQHMGREVIQNEDKHRKYRHLYLAQRDASEILQEGMDKIEGLILDFTMSPEKQINGEIFFPKLRLLEIIGAHDIRGDMKDSFSNLRCIRWHHCPWKQLPSSFCPEKLVVLDMPFCESETPWKSTKPMMSLKIINMSYSLKLKTTPDFTNFKAVEKLLFRGCESLSEVDPSIGQLADLAYLDLSECISLERLPNSMEYLINLSCLNMSGCSNLTQLPEILGKMEGLEMLDVSCTAIEQLPHSIVQLKQLYVLRMRSCNKLRKLPEQFGKLKCLTKFDASCSAIEELPDSFGDLINLVELDLQYCKNLRYLPSSVLRLKLFKYAVMSRL